MSLIKQAYATPSRVKGAFRFLHQSGQAVNRTELEESLSPKALQPNVNHQAYKHLEMIRAVVSETVKMGLFEEKGESIALSSKLDQHPVTDDNLPYLITLLLSSDENEENNDLMKFISWFLMQDPYDAPGTWEKVSDALLKQIGAGMLGMNDVRFGQFYHWFVFLGFGWRYAFAKSERNRLVPDPGKAVKFFLPEIFKDKQVLTIQEFMDQLSALCPVFEGGKIRSELNREYQIELLQPKQLSKVTSFFLLNYHEQGIVELAHKSDADVFIMNDGARQFRYSEVRWLRKGESSKG